MHSSSNFGDILLTLVLRDWLLEVGVSDLSLLSPAPEVAKTLELQKARFSDLWQADIMLLGGGGFFQRMDQNIGASKAIVRYGAPVVLAGLFGKSTGMIGVGIDKMPHPLLDRLLGLVLRRMDCLIVRDATGFQQAKHLLGQNSAQLEQATDLVFALDRTWLSSDAVKWAAKLRKTLGTKHLLAVHLSNPPDSGHSYRLIAEELERLLSSEKDVGILLIEDHPNRGGPQEQAQREMANRLGMCAAQIIAYPGAKRLAALLAEVDAVFSNKLHVGLTAAAMGTMPFSVAKHRKNIASFDDIGLGDNCCLLDDAPVRILSVVNHFVHHRGSFTCPSETREKALAARLRLMDLLRHG
jgi:polysaccharide pyruvyl transferase WcaK-like protein